MLTYRVNSQIPMLTGAGAHGFLFQTSPSRCAGASSEVVVGEREVYFPQYIKIYVGLNDSNKTK